MEIQRARHLHSDQSFPCSGWNCGFPKEWLPLNSTTQNSGLHRRIVDHGYDFTAFWWVQFYGSVLNVRFTV